MDTKPQSSLSTYKRTNIPSTSTAQKLVRSGSANLRERTTFGGTSWKPKRLELDGEVLSIVNASSNKRIRIRLQDITQLERTDLTDHSLCLKTKDKLFNFSFTSDPELYDWQDDIYQRCPLGNYSAPFDFVHKSHIGSDNVTGTFTDANILPIYAEIIGQPGVPVSKSSSPNIVVAPRSRPVSGVLAVSKGGVGLPTTLGLAASSKPLASATTSTTLEGLFVIKQSAGLFASWMWKARWLTLTPQSLVVHRRDTKASPPSKTILLSLLTRIEIDTKRENCLIVEFTPRQSSSPSTPTETISMLFKGNTDLYTWRDALYLRSPLSSPISNPTNFVHHVHVGFDEISGLFTGLPSEWQAAINPSSSATAASAAEKKARRQSRRKSAPLVAPVSA